MKKTKNVFIDDLHMETQTVFYANGDINITPCGFELGQHIVLGGTRVSQRGRILTEDDGTSHFRPYGSDKSRVQKLLMRTRHGELKATKTGILCRWFFGQKHLTTELVQAFCEEARQMAAWMEKHSKGKNRD